MTSKVSSLLRTGALATGALLLSAVPAFAEGPPPPDKGDTAWMLISTILVLLMTIPGLALFYGGLVRAKNMLSVLTQVLTIVCLVAVIWVLYGYSLAFTGGSPFIGGFSKALLAGVTTGSPAATFSTGVYIPEFVFIAFQMTFACITCALIIGAFAERVKFSALLLFTIVWVTVVYFPMAHMVWYWDGPDAFVKAAVDGTFDQALAGAGLLFQWGALDFAGGTVVHINSGIAGLVGCIILGKRIGFGKEPMPPHSLVMTMIGAALLWVGWFGFNAGSNLESNGLTALAMVNTFIAPAAAGLAWLLTEWVLKGKASLLGLASGVVAGLVAVTPAAGFASVGGSLVLGLVAGVLCFFACTTLKNALGYDDSLDVFGIHCIGGIIGALGTGILASPDLGGQGIADYTTKPGEILFSPNGYDIAGQVWIQAKGVLVTLALSGGVSAILFTILKFTIGLRVPADKEREGLDISEHGERAYNS
jgi:ammonium transporter, Amt family